MGDEADKGGARGPLALVLDLGGSWVRVALVTADGDLLWKERKSTASQEGGTAVVARVDELLQQGIVEAGERGLAGIGMALAGPVDPETGIMYSPPNNPGLDGVSLKAIWEKRVSCPVLVGNDATLAALGEYSYGAGVGARTLVYITVSTGIGGGVVVDGRPLMGAHGMAAELGHMKVQRNGPICQCGHDGCLESLASGTAISEMARKLLEEGGVSTLGEMVAGDTARISAETVFEAAEQGDVMSRDILLDVAQALGLGLVNVLHIFNPDVIVLGGGVSTNWDYLRPAVQSFIDANAMDHVLKMGFRLEVSSLGDDIGLLGAAALVWSGISSQGPS